MKTRSANSTNNTATAGRALPDPVGDYARKVIGGKIPAGKWVKLACVRHIRDVKRAASLGLRFDRALAMRSIEFFPKVLRHYKGEWAGKAFELSPWQKFIVGSLFGWIVIATGLRRFRTAYLEVPRKNGKSALVAGIGLILFLFDNEPGAEIYAAATKRDQAKIVWGDAERFVARSPALARRVQVYKGSLLYPDADAVFIPLSADHTTMDGLNPHGVLIDELHRHPSRAIVDVMETAQGARRQPLQVEITTAGDNVNSVCWDHHDYTEKVLEDLLPVEDLTWFGYIAAADKDDNWTDPKTWAKANPNLGISKKLEDLKLNCERAKNQPAAQRDFKRLHLDIWAEGAGGWMPMSFWNACAAAVDPELLKGRECTAGLDLSSTADLTAYVELYAPTPADPLWRVLPFLWVPEAKVIEAKHGIERDRVRYDLWQERGFVRSTPGNVIDYRAIFNCIVDERAPQVKIREIGFDPWAATQISNDLMDEGFNMVEVRQGFKTLSEPTKKLMELVLGGQIAHGGHPVLRWMAANVSIDKDPADNHKPNKAKSRHRIDGIVALIIALSRAIGKKVETESNVSVYATRGIQTV